MTRSAGFVARLALGALVFALPPTASRAQAVPDPASAAEEATAEEQARSGDASDADEAAIPELAPEAVARDSERVSIELPEVDLDLLHGNSRARELDARRRRLAWLGTVQGGLVLVLTPLAVRTINRTADPVVRGVTASWLALGASIVTATSLIGAHASLLESRLYRCNDRPTARRNARTAFALGVIPGLSLLSPLFAHRQHLENERTRLCELRETLRARRVRIVQDGGDE